MVNTETRTAVPATGFKKGHMNRYNNTTYNTNNTQNKKAFKGKGRFNTSGQAHTTGVPLNVEPQKAQTSDASAESLNGYDLWMRAVAESNQAPTSPIVYASVVGEPASGHLTRTPSSATVHTTPSTGTPLTRGNSEMSSLSGYATSSMCSHNSPGEFEQDGVWGQRCVQVQPMQQVPVPMYAPMQMGGHYNYAYPQPQVVPQPQSHQFDPYSYVSLRTSVCSEVPLAVGSCGSSEADVSHTKPQESHEENTRRGRAAARSGMTSDSDDVDSDRRRGTPRSHSADSFSSGDDSCVEAAPFALLSTVTRITRTASAPPAISRE